MLLNSLKMLPKRQLRSYINNLPLNTFLLSPKKLSKNHKNKKTRENTGLVSVTIIRYDPIEFVKPIAANSQKYPDDLKI